MVRISTLGVCASFYYPGASGGVDTFLKSLILNMRKYRPDIRLVLLHTPPVYQPFVDELRSVGVETHQVHLDFPIWQKLPRKLSPKVFPPLPRHVNLRKQVAHLDIDLLVFARSMLEFKDQTIPTALHLFDIQHEYYPEFFSEAEAAQRKHSYREDVISANRVIASTEYTRQSLLEKGYCAEDHVSVAYPGVTPSCRISPEEIKTVHERFGLPEKFMFFPANPWAHKNHARLLAALSLIRERTGRKLALVCAGRLIHEAPFAIKRLAVAARVEEQVYDLGYVSDIELAALYQSAKFLIFPSLFEGFGFPVIEAMAAGCPVACANATSLPEIVGDAALLFDPMDIESIADAILKMWDDSNFREELCQKGLENWRRFDWETAIKTITSLYQSVIADSSTPNKPYKRSPL